MCLLKSLLWHLVILCVHVIALHRKAQEKVAELETEIAELRDREAATHEQLTRTVMQVSALAYSDHTA